ncbi:transcription initiation factor TFIID subunit A-domain-containing protein [Apiospora arundinis]
MDYFSALLEPGDLFTLKQAFQGQGNAMLIGYDLPRLDCTALSTPADESSPIHLILTWYGEGHSLFLNPNLKHKKVMSFRNVRVVLWIAPPSDLFIFNVDKYTNYVRNDRSTNLVYLFDEAPGLRDIKVTHVEDCWLGRFNLLFKVDNLPKDIRKQYESQTSHTSIEPDDGSFSQDDTGAANFNPEPFQLHDGVRTSSGDVDESIETDLPERSRVSLEPATNPRHSGGSCSLEVDHDPQESLVGNEGQDSDLDLDWANTFRYRRLAKRRQERAAASLGRIRFPRPTAKSQKYTKVLLADRAKAKIQNCTSKRQKQTNAKISVNDNGKGVFGVVQGNLSKSEDCNAPGPSAGEDRTLETDAQNPYSYTDSQTATPVSLLSTEGSSKSKERISGTASPGTPQAPRRQSPSDQSVRAASRRRTHQWTEDQDPITMVESYLLSVGDGTGNGTDTRTPRSSIPKLANKRTRSLRPAQPAKGPLGGVSASSGLFKGMVFALSFNSEDEAARQLTKSLIQRASGKILVTGFDELFEPACLGLPLDLSPSTAARSLALKSNFQATSFTALIADSHSRKAKYMQALALGLPCLSAKWISTCVSRGKVMGWSSYVLCAGSSRVLSGAICSRNIPIYEASSKTLPETLEESPALLRNMFILVGQL